MNCRAAARRYSVTFPNRRAPHHSTFAAVDRRLRESGTLKKSAHNSGRPRALRIETEEAILDAIENNPRESVRRLSRQFYVGKDAVHRMLKEQLLRPFHFQRVQELLEVDHAPRLEFCTWLENRFVEEDGFLEKIFFTDESCFTRNGVTNFHNLHVWMEENPKEIRPYSFQRQFSVNVWAGIVGDCLIGPFALPARLNGETYLNFLQNSIPELLEDVPLEIRRQMIFMHGGAPPHYTNVVRQHLNRNYPDRWIGRGNDAPVRWPPRSPDITPMDFYLWGAVKQKVYATPVDNQIELWNRIVQAFNEIRQTPNVFQRVRTALLRRARSCVRCNGGHFEQLLN